MIEKIMLDNFKSHAHTEIELGRVTALVGPNGCGKTSVLQAVYALNQLVSQIVVAGSWNWNSILQFVRKGQDKDSIGISVIGKNRSWGVLSFGSNISDLESRHDIHAELLKAFGKVVYFKANAQSIASPSYKLDIPPVIGPDGDGLAAVISYLKTSQEETHAQIEQDLKTIVPLVKRVRVRPVPKTIKEKRTLAANGNTLTYDEDRQVIAHELIFDTGSGAGLPANLMSEGTLITLALLTLLHTSGASLFLLDDIEQGLHPLAQIKLMQMLNSFAEQHNKQILLTTHSPYVVDKVNANNVWVMATDKEGISHCQQLSKAPNAEFGLKVLTTGEFLDAEGEEWVLNPPVQEEPAHV